MFEAAWLTPSNEKTEELAEKSKREAVRVQLSSAYTPSAKELLPEAKLELPYEGAKPMLLPDIDDKALLAQLVPAVFGDLKSKK